LELEAIEQFLRRDLELYLVADIDDRMYAIRRIGSAGLLDMRVHQALNSLAQKLSSISSIEEKEKRVLEFLQSMESELRKELKELIIGEATARKSAWEGGIFYLTA
jgi:prefoldin subunit 5